jgi:hypothetical protein
MMWMPRLFGWIEKSDSQGLKYLPHFRAVQMTSVRNQRLDTACIIQLLPQTGICAPRLAANTYSISSTPSYRRW